MIFMNSYSELMGTTGLEGNNHFLTQLIQPPLQHLATYCTLPNNTVIMGYHADMPE